MNNDVVLPNASGCLYEMLKIAEHSSKSNYGVFGTIMNFLEGPLQHAGVDFFRQKEIQSLCYHPQTHLNLNESNFPLFFEVPAVTGAFLLMRSNLFESCSGFNEAYAAECQDIELCLRAHRMGSRAAIINIGHVVHYENGTRTKGEENWLDRQYFMRLWASYIQEKFL